MTSQFRRIELLRAGSPLDKAVYLGAIFGGAALGAGAAGTAGNLWVRGRDDANLGTTLTGTVAFGGLGMVAGLIGGALGAAAIRSRMHTHAGNLATAHLERALDPVRWVPQQFASLRTTVEEMARVALGNGSSAGVVDALGTTATRPRMSLVLRDYEKLAAAADAADSLTQQIPTLQQSNWRDVLRWQLKTGQMDDAFADLLWRDPALVEQLGGDVGWLLVERRFGSPQFNRLPARALPDELQRSAELLSAARFDDAGAQQHLDEATRLLTEADQPRFTVFPKLELARRELEALRIRQRELGQ